MGSVWGVVADGEDVVRQDRESKEAEKAKKVAEKKSGRITRDPPKRGPVVRL